MAEPLAAYVNTLPAPALTGTELVYAVNPTTLTSQKTTTGAIAALATGGGGGGGGATPPVVADQVAGSIVNGTVTLAFPDGAPNVGDTLIAFASCQHLASITAPPGWVYVTGTDANNVAIGLWVRVATAADAANSYAWANSDGYQTMIVRQLRITGATALGAMGTGYQSNVPSGAVSPQAALIGGGGATLGLAAFLTNANGAGSTPNAGWTAITTQAGSYSQCTLTKGNVGMPFEALEIEWTASSGSGAYAFVAMRS